LSSQRSLVKYIFLELVDLAELHVQLSYNQQVSKTVEKIKLLSWKVGYILGEIKKSIYVDANFNYDYFDAFNFNYEYANQTFLKGAVQYLNKKKSFLVGEIAEL
jgi:hypothetical protein